MRYVAAYLLACLGGKSAPTKDDVAKILGSVGIEVETEKLTNVLNSLKGKNIQEIIAEGEKKLANVPAGGGGGGGSGGGGGGGGGAVKPSDTAAAPAAEEKKEAAKVESEEESDDDMGFGLFD